MNFRKQFREGLLTKNPVLVQLLGMCSTLAITTSLFNGLGMGVAVTVILICSNIMNGIEAPDGEFTTPVADVLAVQIRCVFQSQMVGYHGLCHQCLVGDGHAV